jgi:hypothetical protein
MPSWIRIRQLKLMRIRIDNPAMYSVILLYLPPARRGESARRRPGPRAQTPERSSVSRADPRPRGH